MICTKWRPETGSLGPMEDTHEWRAMRDYNPDREPPVVFGASDASVIAGLSDYNTQLGLYHEKRGLRSPKETSEAMSWGKYLQPGILRRYEDMMSCRVSEFPYMIHWRDKPYIVATPDGVAWEDPDEEDPWLIEIKNCSGFRYDAKHGRERNCFGEAQDEVPLNYVMQCQQQMLVTGLESCDLPVLFDGRKLRLYCVTRNDELIDKLVKMIDEFAERVANGDPPEPDFSNKSTLEMIKEIYPVEPIEIDLTGGMVQYAEKYIRCQNEIKQLESEKKEAQAQLLHAMKEASVANIEGSGYTLRRSAVGDSMWTDKDIEKARRNLGNVKRRGYTRFSIKQ